MIGAMPGCRENTEQTEWTEQTENPKEIPSIPSIPFVPYSLIPFIIAIPMLKCGATQNFSLNAYYFLGPAELWPGFPLLKYNCATTLESEIRELSYAKPDHRLTRQQARALAI
jgi:hypothetical protein